jgi:cysteine desulfurase / selenocysteine lyase
VIGNFFSRGEFPTLKNNPNLIYLDNAATTQTHRSVIERMNAYYNFSRATSHRGDYPLSHQVTDEYATARSQVASLINVDADKVMFTTGATQGLNFVAEWCKDVPVVILSGAEHSSNIIPWLAQGRSLENGRLKIIPITVYSDGSQGVDLEAARDILEKHPESVLSITTTSNATGFNTEWDVLLNMAHAVGTRVCLDITQSVAHKQIDLSKYSAEWAVFSAHKMYGPTGVGALYCRFGFEYMRPLQYGGGQIDYLDFNSALFKNSIERMEPGTQNIAGILGFGVAAEFINYVTYDEIRLIELNLYECFISNKDIKSLIELDRLFSVRDVTNIFSFRSNKYSPYDMATILGSKGIAVRSGRVCAHPFVNDLSNNGILRISLAPYNTEEEIELLGSKLAESIALLK